MKSTPFGRMQYHARTAAQMTLSQVSKKSGVSISMLCDIEKGRRIPASDAATRIARAVGREPLAFALAAAMATGRIEFDPSDVGAEAVLSALTIIQRERPE